MPAVTSEGVFRKEITTEAGGRASFLFPFGMADFSIRAVQGGGTLGSVKKSYSSGVAIVDDTSPEEDQITSGLDAVGTTPLFHSFGDEYPVGLIMQAEAGQVLTVVVTARMT